MIHPLFYVGARLKLRGELRAKGYRFGEINDLVAGATDEVIDAASVVSNTPLPTLPTSEGVGAIGDGTILQAIMDFLKSPAGQALIQALITLLIGAL